jgi:hypothetical protein
MPKINIDVSGVGRTIRRFKQDFHRGMENAADEIAEDVKDEARNVISANNAIFNAEVYAGFKQAEVKNNSRTVRVKIYNDVEHAEVLEKGAEYPNDAPPVEGLLPWVKREMNWRPERFDDNDSDGIPDSFFGGGYDSSDGDSNESAVGSDSSLERLDEEYTKSDVEKGLSVFVESSSRDRLVEITRLRDSTFVGENDNGTFEFDYSQIISPAKTHPVVKRMGEFERGDRVTFHDGDEFRDGILTGDRSFVHSVDTWTTVDAETGNTIGDVPETEFLEWEPAPGIETDRIPDSMDRFTVEDNFDAKQEIVHPFQNVFIYDAFEGTTKSGTVKNSPWLDEVEVLTGDGDTIVIDSSNWDIVAGEDFSSLSESTQVARLLDHYDSSVTIDGGGQKDIDYIKDKLKEYVFPSYTDRDHLAKVIFSLEVQEITSDRSSVGVATDGWGIRTKQHPDNSSYDPHQWDQTFGHEFGHAYSQPIEGDKGTRKHDPEGYRIATNFVNKDDPSFDYMFDNGLPAWEFGASDPFHGYKEQYMFTPQDADAFISYNSPGDIQLDTRDSMSPYGFSEWGEEVKNLAQTHAAGLKRAELNSKLVSDEIGERQIFGRENWEDDFSIETGEDGDIVSIEIDGEEKPYRLVNRDGSPTNFVENEDEDVPREAEAVRFEPIYSDEEDISLYIGLDGTIYDTEFDGSFYHLSKKEAPDFIGTASLINYDESDDEFPELTESTPEKRLHEAANMAWWYQAKFIENGNVEDSISILPRPYSASNVEETMAVFGEVLTHPNPDHGQLKDLELLMERYPFFVEAYLAQRKPISSKVRDELKDNGFI